MLKVLLAPNNDAGFRDHTSPIFKQLKLLKIQDIYNFQLGIYMYKARQRGEYAPQSLVHTRRSNLPRHPLRRITSTQHSISYTGPLFWNQLPPSLRSINNLNRFKKSLKEHLLDKY